SNRIGPQRDTFECTQSPEASHVPPGRKVTCACNGGTGKPKKHSFWRFAVGQNGGACGRVVSRGPSPLTGGAVLGIMVPKHCSAVHGGRPGVTVKHPTRL